MSSGPVYEKVRQLIVHILKEHKLTNNFKTNIISNQHPSGQHHGIAVFKISEPWLSDGSISGKIKTAKNTIGTWGSVSQEIFPQRVMGALADLYIVLFALYDQKIPENKKDLTEALNNDTIFTKKGAETTNEDLTRDATGDNAEKEVPTKEANKDTNEETAENESIDANTPSISDKLLSQMFTTLLLKKKKTHKHYKNEFDKVKNKNKNNNDDIKGAKNLIQKQILYIIETVGNVSGGMRKTRKSKSKIGSRRRNKKSPGHKKSKKHRRKSYRNRRR